MRAITTQRELIAPWLRMRRSLAQFSGSDALCRMPWSAGCIINTSESKFSVHTGRARLRAVPQCGRPVIRLYFHRAKLACRHCCRAVYLSQMWTVAFLHHTAALEAVIDYGP